MKKVSFIVRQGVVRFDASTLDEVQTIVKNDIFKDIDFVVEEVATKRYYRKSSDADARWIHYV